MIGGTFYCNTPEYYRMCESHGVGDKHESCIHSYRQGRGDQPVIFRMKEFTFEPKLQTLTIHRGKKKDAWLHCWMTLEIPEEEAGLHSLVSDLNRMRLEFGNHFAFIPYKSINPFVACLRELTALDILRGPVKYSNDSMDRSPACKDSSFSYQREFRFLIGQCTLESAPLVLQYPHGFRELIFKDMPLQIVDPATGAIWLHLDTQTCFCPTCTSPTCSSAT